MIKYNSIDEAIDEAGLKQEFIAKKMGISRQRLYDLRKNPTLLNIEQMELLANILNLKFSDIYDIRKKFKKEVDKNTTKKRMKFDGNKWKNQHF